MLVVSDSSPLNVLVRIGYAEILRTLFISVIIPPAVAAELSHANTPDAVRSWMTTHHEWLAIKAPSHIDPTLQLNDVGEAEPLAWRWNSRLIFCSPTTERLGVLQRKEVSS